MTVAYPLTRQADYTELKYSLRSLINPTEVLIIGETLPDWITNVTHIHLPDTKGRAQISVKRKIYAALEYSDEILFMNDDIYFLKPFPIDYYQQGDLKMNQHSGSKQLQTELKAMGKPTINFELHVPIVFKKDFKEVIENFSSDTLIRSAYCNYLGLKGPGMADCKLLKKIKTEDVRSYIKDRAFLSTGPNSLQSVLPILNEMFNDKCIFER